MVFTNQSLNEPAASPNAYLDAARIQNYRPNTSEVVGAFVDEAFEGVGTLEADLRAERVEAPGTAITQDEWRESNYFREGIDYYDGMTQEAARILSQTADEVEERAFIISGASPTQLALGFTSGFGAGVFEPKNAGIGLGTALIGGAIANRVVGAARLAKAYQKYGRYRSRIAVGGTEGLVAAAVAEPSNRDSAKVLQQDYDMTDSLMNVGLSMTFGAFVNTAPAYIKDKVTRNKGKNILLDELDTATTQLAEGQKIDVEAVEIARNANPDDVIADIELRALREISELRESRYANADRIKGLLDERARLLTEIRKSPKTRGILSVMRKEGVRDFQGELANIGINSRSAPGVVRSNGGKTLDDLGEQLAGLGYFDERPSVPELLEAIDLEFNNGIKRVARGDRDFDAETAELNQVVEDLEAELSELGFDYNDQVKLDELDAGIRRNATIEERVAEIRKRGQDDVAKIQNAVAAKYDKQNTVRADEVELAEFDASLERARNTEVADFEADIQRMREDGLLDEDDIAVLDELDAIDQDAIIAAHDAARICLTRG